MVPDRLVWVSTWAVTQKNSKYPASSRWVDENALLVWDVRGGRADYFQMIQQLRNSIYHLWMHNQPNLEDKGLQQQESTSPTPVSWEQEQEARIPALHELFRLLVVV